ncbi:sensory transduction histidine kinase, putative [Heliomicrobium modesticaldum Ice1]|uniref:Stage 0 sporulation protein A homolog n=1 Tax=Heliobacterium modesticaldum (strain ATCC 51547 / Ice1) TaxID=498761 RepID=B0TDV2_HELMI|nr:chemotaxis protein CheB [Heliomicrobium modesticaldum]ABZ82815.1 sensory transduction histidine kinase, putative [Heliomicrobium modesticaldum Ice1]
MEERNRDNEQALWVLAIGASAGGLRAIQEVLNRLSPDKNLAVFVVQHLSPRYPSHLTAILKRTSLMDVKEAVQDEVICGGTIYVATPNHHLVLHGNRIHLDAESEKVKFARPSIDVLFESAAEAFGSRVIGVVLSGTGSDGSNGIISIKEHGGFTIAQDSSNSHYNAMPQNAINTGAIDFVLPLNEIPKIVSQILKEPDTVRRELTLDEHMEIADMLRRRLNIDVINYRRSTFKRRVRKRMSQLHYASVQEYIEHLKQYPEELDELHDDLLINVTQFLRDEAAYESLRLNCLEPLIARAKDGDTLRVWSVGCSTGEEPYSVAFMIADMLEASQKKLELKIYATDLDEAAILEARRGLYNESKVRSLPEAYREKYMIACGDFYKVKKHIRSCVIFGVQDIVHSAPIAKVDLLICRNLLIYFDKELQKKVLTMFHYALNPGGFLFLGKSETTSVVPELFDFVDRRWKIYRARPVPTRRVPYLRPRNSWIHLSESDNRLNRRFVADSVLENLAAPVIVLNEQMKIVLINRRADELLTNDIAEADKAELEREPLLFRLLGGTMQAEMQECFQSGLVPPSRDISATWREMPRHYVLSFFLDADEDRKPVLILTFTPVIRRTAGPVLLTEREIDSMEKELSDALSLAEELQSTNEELETTNEELQAANEELETTNEELESANEELETTNEELEAANEELETINEELEVRTLELLAVSALKNSVLTSINVAVIAIDLEGRVLEWNPAATKLFDIPSYKAVNNNLFGLQVPPFFEELKPHLTRLIEGENETVSRTVIPWRNKSFNVDYVPLYNEEQQIVGLLIVAYDITEQHELQRQLQAALEKEHNLAEELAMAKADAERANHMKTRFIAELSHDLRGSLNVILGVTQLGVETTSQPAQEGKGRQEGKGLSEGEALPEREAFREEIATYFDMIRKAAENLNNLLTQVLELSSIELGKKAVENKVFSIPQLADQVSAVIAYKARRARVDYNVDNRVPPRLLVESDFSKLCQILLNLLDNAVKYSQAGGEVTFRISRDGDRLQLIIADRGIGMSPETVAHIFDPFYRAKGVSKITGSGLGMAITQQLVQTLKGEIHVESREGVGTTVTVAMPVRYLEMPAEADARGPIDMERLKASMTGRRVLIVDEDATSLLLLSRVITVLGGQPAVARGTEEAIAASTVQPPDLILTEAELPDGYAADMISAITKLMGASPPVVLVTSDIFQVNQTGHWRAYADELTAKPVALNELYACLWRVLERSGSENRMA